MASSKSPSVQKGWILSGLGMLLVIIVVGIAFSQSVKWGLITIGIGVLLIALWLIFNPKFRFMRMALSVLSAWFSARAVPTLEIWRVTDRIQLGIYVENHVGWAFDLGCALLTIFLVWLDYRLRDGNSLSCLTINALPRIVSPQHQIGGSGSQLTQVGDIQIVGNNNQVRISGAEAKKDFNPDIDNAANHLKSGKLEIALEYFQDLKRRYWDSLGAREKFRVVANLGHTHSRLGHTQEAIKFYLEAKSYQEHDEQALSLEAVAYLLMGELEKARSVALKVLDQFPTSEISTSVLIQTATSQQSVSELKQDISAHLLYSQEVLSALFRHAFKRDEQLEAETIARELKQLDGNCSSANEFLRATLIRKAVLFRQCRFEANKKEILQEVHEGMGLLTLVIESQNVSDGAQKVRARYYRAIGHKY